VSRGLSAIAELLVQTVTQKTLANLFIENTVVCHLWWSSDETISRKCARRNISRRCNRVID